MEKIKVTVDDEKIVIKRKGKVTFDELFDALRNTHKVVPIASPYPYLDTFIQILGTRDAKFYKLVGREVQLFTDEVTNKMVMLSFKPTTAEFTYISDGIMNDIKEILR